MNGIEFEPAPQWQRDVYGIASLAIATLLIVAAADGLSGHYQALRIVVCVFSLVTAHLAYYADKKGWLIFAVVCATLFNPLPAFRMEMEDWSFVDMIFAIGYGAYGIGLVSRQIGKIVSVGIWAVFVGLCGTTYYVSRYMPHGPSYPTGEIVCQNDDRGPCGEEHREDMRGLNIPHWAKFVRADADGWFVLLLLAGTVSSVKAWKEDEEPEWWDDTEATAAACGQGESTDPDPTSRILLNEPIERAARALAKCAGQSDPEAWRRQIPRVRTVLEALDEPTSSMIDAGNAAMRGAWIARGLSAPPVAGDAAVSAAWEAMIDRLLGHA